MKQVVDDENRYQLGKTKVFFRAFLLESLEKRRSSALAARAVHLQRHLRGLFWRRRFLSQRASAVQIQTARRMLRPQSQYARKRRAALVISSSRRGMQARKLARLLRVTVRIKAHVRAFLSRRRTARLRRFVCATRIQAGARRLSSLRRFRSLRKAALRLQSFQRMIAQRRHSRRDLADKKEEATLSTQIA